MISGSLVDSHGRVMRDLRISVTDRCNFRCLYCLPETEEAANFYQKRWAPPTAESTKTMCGPIEWQPKANLLTFEEIERTARIAVGLGIEKIRITGGEPLLRAGVEKLIGKIAAIPGVRDLAMTTNGFLFWQKAQRLKDEGLKRISFSLDSLDRNNFKKITGRDGLAEVMRSIDRALEFGFHPVKINAVVIRGLNDHEVENLARFALDRGLMFRFIEFMPLDSRRAWQRELVVSNREVLARLQKAFDLEPAATQPSETARRWRFRGTAAEVGLISPVTEPFCGHCNRLRMTSDGQIRTCLFSVVDHDLRGLLRGGCDDEGVADFLRDCVHQKEARHHIGEKDFVAPSKTMSCVGG